MIRQLLRRDPLLSQPAAFIKFTMFGAALCNGAAFWAAIGVLHGRGTLLAPGSLDYAAVTGITWLLLSILLLVMKATTRCTPLDLALPVPHRVAWRTRVGVTLAACLVLPAFASLALVLVNRVNRVPAPVTQSALAMMLALVSGAVLSVSLIQRYRPRECALRLTRHFLLYFAGVTFGILTLILLLTAIAPILCALLALAGILVLWITDRGRPPTLLLLPSEADAARATAAAPTDASAVAGSGAQPLWLLTVRMLYAFEGSLGWAFAVLPLLAIYGILIGLDRSAFVFVQATWIWALAVIAAILPLARLHRLDPLPLARSRILPWIALPIVLIPILSLIGTRIIAPAGGDPLVSCRWIEADGQPGRCGIQVSTDLWKASWNGTPPLAVAPTGETHPLAAVPVARGSRLAAYNPYATPEGSSPEFIAWQLNRALEAAFGVSIPAAELQRRYLIRDRDGRAAWAAAEPDLERDYPQLKPAARLGALPVAALSVGLPILLLLAWLMRPLAEARREAVRRRFWRLLVAGPFILSVAFVVATMKGLFEPHSAIVLARAMFERFAQTALGRSAVLWTVSLALLVLGYAMAQRAFRRLETPEPDKSW